MSNLRILSLDGGGIRGLYSLVILSMIEKQVSLFDHFDLFAGTSTGSLIALCLSMGMNASDILEMYMKLGPHVFVPSEDSSGAKYNNKPLQVILSQTIFSSNPKLSDLKKRVLIPSFKLFDDELGRWCPYVFDNFSSSASKEAYAIDVAVSSCSAPIYFPSYSSYIDGGVFAPNPTMQAVCRSVDKNGGETPLNDIRVLSIGTGILPLSVKSEISWSAKDWTEQKGADKLCDYPMLTMMVDAMSESVHKQCLSLLGSQYTRINTDLKEVIEIDAHEKAGKLFEVASEIPTRYEKLFQTWMGWISDNLVANRNLDTK